MNPLIQLGIGPDYLRKWIAQGLTLILSTTILLSLQGCGKPKAMDVVWSADPVKVDHNGLSRNPVWFEQSQTGQPPDACSVCPCGQENGQAWRSAANCTDALPETNSGICFGHWNWLPVEYEGTVTWAGHSNSVYDDDDYYLYIKRDDQALQTSDSRDGVELEFDSEETVDYWDDTHTWWDDFHHNYVDNNDEAAHGHIDNKFAIIVGMLGIDKKHGVHTELHPVYAMFVHVQDDPAQDKWGFFVRNWGNEGYCASHQEYADFRGRSLRVLIPHPPGATGFSESDNVWVYGDNEDDFNQQSWSFQNTNEGLLLTFNLQDPSKQDGFVGDLTINWGGTVPGAPTNAGTAKPVAQRPSSSRAVPGQGDEDVALKAKFDKLDPATQKVLVKELKNLTHHPAPKLIKGTPSTLVVERVKPTGRGPAYGNIVRSVPDTAGEARRAKQRDAALAFLTAHGVD
jgi:hypothetical protein